MIFDQPPADLPVATLRPHDVGAQLLLDARGWLASKWRWLKPRSIPVAAAFAGMLGVLASASYLRDLAHQRPEQLPAPVLATSRAEDPLARVRIVSHPAGSGTVVAKPAPVVIVNRHGAPVAVKIEPGVYRVQIEPAAPPAP